MRILISWFALAIVHLMPTLSLFAPALLTRLYGVQRSDALFLLMHHRAALFLAILVICVRSAFDPAPRRLAVVAVGISMLSFLGLYLRAGSPPSLRAIALADLIGVPALVYATCSAYPARFRSRSLTIMVSLNEAHS